MQCTFCTYLHSFTYPFIDLLHAKCRACMQFKFLNFCSITATVASTITNMQHCTTMTHAGKLKKEILKKITEENAITPQIKKQT